MVMLDRVKARAGWGGAWQPGAAAAAVGRRGALLVERPNRSNAWVPYHMAA